MTTENYKEKYLKYKQKYISLQKLAKGNNNISGGALTQEEIQESYNSHQQYLIDVIKEEKIKVEKMPFKPYSIKTMLQGISQYEYEYQTFPEGTYEKVNKGGYEYITFTHPEYILRSHAYFIRKDETLLNLLKEICYDGADFDVKEYLKPPPPPPEPPIAQKPQKPVVHKMRPLLAWFWPTKKYDKK